MEPEKPTEETVGEDVPKASPDEAGATEPASAPKSARKKVSKKLLIILAVVIALGIAAAIYLFVIKDKPAPSNAAKQTSTPEKLPEKPVAVPTPAEAELAKQIERFTTPTTGEKWHSLPKEIPLQGYLTTNDNKEDGESVKYYEVGTRGNNIIIMSTENYVGLSAYLFEKTPDGVVTAITHPSATATYTAEYDTYYKFADSVKVDIKTHYDSLSLPGKFDLGNGEYAAPQIYPTIGHIFLEDAYTNDTNTVVTTIKKFGDNALQKSVRTYADTKLAAIGYNLVTPLHTSIRLIYDPITLDFKNTKWDNGVVPAEKFGGIVRGCGAGISVSRADAVTDADFVKAGTTSTGQVLYNFKDSNNTLVQKALQETHDFYNYDGGKDPKSSISLGDFIKNHGIFAYKSLNQGWLIYTSDAYAPIGGCAKPVVYLYPTSPQPVSVKVGADVKISDPLYDPATGWHTFAWPNGQLIVNGKVYGSLFWEGPGHGEYPGITSGTVVKRADAATTIRKQLAQQGLNKTETDEFMTYWESKIPNKPYIRLAWFTTAQLNELAPLAISPKPTTLIRVFLDMAGYDQPVSLPAPSFNAPARNGFTAVEWGGLARGKLY